VTRRAGFVTGMTAHGDTVRGRAQPAVSPLELAANLLNGLAIVFAGRNSWHTWWTSIVGCALFAVLFYQTKLYADVVLQGFFIVASVIGWRVWTRGTAVPERPVTGTPPRLLALAVGCGVLLAVAYGAALQRLTDAAAPFADATVLAFSIAAQLLLTQRYIETWPLWLLVNTIAVPLFASRGLLLTAVLYAGYWVHALVAWRHWARLRAQQARQ